MYKVVDKMTPVARKYEQQLIEEGTLSAEAANQMKQSIKDKLEASYVNA